MEILRAARNDKLNNEEKLINSSHEIYGACRHKSKFHRYRIFFNSSTDEGPSSPERRCQYPSDDSQDLTVNTVQDTLNHSYLCVPVPLEKSNGSIVANL